MKAKYTVIAVFMLTALFMQSSLAVAAAPAKTSSTVTTKVTSDNMVYDSAARKVVFSGNVKVVHPDFTLNSDTLQLFLGDGGAKATPNAARSMAEGANPGVVQKIIAESKVNIKLPDARTATCNKVTYSVDSETLTMEGNPALREGTNQIRGERMVFYLRENRNEVQGRVAVDFISDGDVPSGLNDAGFGNIGGGR